MNIPIIYEINPNNAAVKPAIIECYNYLNYLGYCTQKVDDKYELFKIEGLFVERVFNSDLIGEVKRYFENDTTRPDDILLTIGERPPVEVIVTAQNIAEKFAKYKWSNIINNYNHVYLNQVTVDFNRHTKDEAFFYFSNGFIRVAANGIEKRSYASLQNNCYVLKSSIIDRDIEVITDANRDQYSFEKAAKGHKFEDFLTKVCLTEFDPKVHAIKTETIDGVDYAVDDAKLTYLMQLIGFLLHDKKIKGATDFMVILCDDDSGGSGKGIIGQAIAQLTQVAEVDAKRKQVDVDPTELSVDTRVKIINDPPKNWTLDRYYNEVTDKGTIKHLFNDPISVDYEKMWKLLVLTNYVVKAGSGHARRRMKILDLFPFFNEKNMVRDYYKQSFFSEDWSPLDWNVFYNRLFDAVQFWLMSDYKINFENKDYQNRLIAESYPVEFIDFIENLQSFDGWYDTGELFQNWVKYCQKLDADGRKLDKYLQEGLMSSSNLFGRKVRGYCTDKNYIFIKTSDRSKVRIIRPGQTELKQTELFKNEDSDDPNQIPLSF
ncbi:MAG: hypothetical protein K9I36_16720 [Bacteroidia bacterium]|nr:hypothetical protein [Bacteroidia bacterium]